MAIDFKEDQLAVIESRGKDVLVSAAAGSGKTAVLVERIVRMVCDGDNPKDIDKLLVVTFTNAAAAEMRERIGSAIEERIEKNPENEHLAKQAVLLHNAKICTIDSFCANVLRNHFNDVDADPSYRTPDEAEIVLIKEDVLKNLLEEWFSETDDIKRRRFENCVEFFATDGNEKSLEEIILRLYKVSESQPFPSAWFDNCLDRPIIRTVEELNKSEFMVSMLTIIKDKLKAALGYYNSAKKIVESPGGPYSNGEIIDYEIEMVSRAIEQEDYDKIQNILNSMSFTTWKKIKKDDDVLPEKNERAKNLRSTAKGIVTGIVKDYLFATAESILQREIECAKQINCMLAVTRDFSEKYSSYKKEKNLMEFSDIEHAALEILTDIDDNGEVVPSKVALEMGKSFDEILIDEYQDTNYIQEYILNALCNDRERGQHLFMVGDVKQSIYKFRQAKPELFMKKYKDFRLDSVTRERLDLQKNYRSRNNVLNITNVIFSRIMDSSFGGIDYDSNAALYYGGTYPEYAGCNPELLLVMPDETEDQRSNEEQEITVIADKINTLVGKYMVKDKESEELRPCKYKDIVILFRGTKPWVEPIKDIFEKKGIPVYLESTTGYFQTVEVKTIIQLLRTIDNPTRNIPMFGSLKSVFGDFTDEEIASVRALSGKEKRTTSLYKNLQMALETGKISKDLQEKIQIFLKQLQFYRKMATYATIRELLQQIFHDYNYLEYVASLPAGERRKANIEMLLVKAGDFEKTSYHGLFHFVRYIEQLEKYKTDEGEAGLQDENADIVRVMTIHKSKGLEFPITFIGGLSKQFNEQDTREKILYDESLGFGADYVDSSARIKIRTPHKKLIADKSKNDARAEELRVLYVAMTRAKEKLIMSGLVAGNDKIGDYFTKLLPIRDEDNWRVSTSQLDCNNLMDFILKALIRHPSIEKVLDDIELEREATRIIDCPYDFCKDESENDIEISLIRNENIILSEAESLLNLGVNEEQLLKDISKSDIDESYYDQVMNRFNFIYKYENLKSLYTKTSVSELKMAAIAQNEEEEGETSHMLFHDAQAKPCLPRFKQEKAEVSGTTRGSAFHRVMELLDFTHFSDSSLSREEKLKDLQGAMEGLVKDQRLTKEYMDAVVPEKIIRFFDSDLAQRMAEASKKGLLYREQPFVYGIPASRLNPDFPSDENILIQGIIDAFFIEDGKIILMDYKTDVIDTPDNLVNRYRVQLDYYKEALESARNMPVSETLIYSFNFGDSIEC